MEGRRNHAVVKVHNHVIRCNGDRRRTNVRLHEGIDDETRRSIHIHVVDDGVSTDPRWNVGIVV